MRLHLEKSDRLYFIIDEAHRGMRGREAGRAITIMQKFLKGSSIDCLEPMPVVIGMSATTERFNSLVEGTSSTIHKVIVTPDEVRSSGLLKDRIVISYSEESSVNKDMAILQAAADNWKEKWEHWHQYCYEQHYAYVNPVFVVQVENGTKEEISKTDLDMCLRKIEERSGFSFTKGEVIHAFGQTDAAIKINGLEVPYEEPSRINDNKQIKVVFFKESLSTGWDCPRAETMMSFRRAKDATYIAQLLGRMVRTPMQMRIQVDDTLNDVHLFLPYFDKNTVEDVIENLQSEEGDSIPTDIYGESIENKKFETLTIRPKRSYPKTVAGMAGQQSMDEWQSYLQGYSTMESKVSYESSRTDKITGKNSINFNIKQDEQAVFIDDGQSEEELTSESEPKVSNDINSIVLDFNREKVVKAINDSGLLTYHVRNIRVNDYLKSLYSLARLLVQSDMKPEASHNIESDIVKIIRSYIDDLKDEGSYSNLVEQAKQFRLSTQVYDVFGQSFNRSYVEHSLFSTDADIDRQFRSAEAKLGNEGVANAYLNKYFDPVNLATLKIDVILFVADDECMVQLNQFAKKEFHALNDQYRRRMTKLHERFRKQYDRIVSDGDAVSKHNFRLPETIKVTSEPGGRMYTQHLFVNDDGFAKIKLNSWEQGVLEEETAREDFVCWLRNPPRAPWALCIPYEIYGIIKPTYPDFIVIRKDPDLPGDYIIDVLEPHNPAFIDNLGKAKGFAEYARQNPGVGRIELIRESKDAAGKLRFKRLDMSKGAVRDKVSQAMRNEELNHIFNIYGYYKS